jgi:hypothetical protein
VAIERNRFFSGQLLSAENLAAEQDYFREKARRHNRMLHGWGIVDGLGVEAGPGDGELTVEPGYALDPYGEEIVVPDAVIVDLFREDEDGNVVSPCPEDEHKRVRKRRRLGKPFYLAVRYAECATRPLAAVDSVEPSRTRESFAVKLLAKLPAAYRERRSRGEPEPWVVLAEVALDPDRGMASVDCHAHRRRVTAPPAG